MELIALMGGTASSLGTVPTDTDPTPCFTKPHTSNENGFCYSVSPDILFTLPDQPMGFASLAQVKIKKVQRELSKEWLYVYQDEKEFHRMNVASQFYEVFFIINLTGLDGLDGFHDWMWLNIDQLKPEWATLIKRRVCDKPTFLLPLNLFRPLSKITKRTLKELANINFASTTEAT